MKYALLFLLILFHFSGVGQDFTNKNCIYSVEGMITDGNTYNIIRYAIIKNNELGISTISDDRGYYCLTFPMRYIDSGKIVELNVYKDGYKSYKWWIGYNPMKSTLNNYSNECLIWNYGLKMIKLSKLNTNRNFNVSTHRRVDTLEHGFSGIKTSFEEFLNGQIRDDKMEALKLNNENVIFKLDGKYVLCFDGTITYFQNKKFIIYVNNKRVKINEINNLLKRSETVENRERQREYYSEHKNSKLSVYFLEAK